MSQCEYCTRKMGRLNGQMNPVRNYRHQYRPVYAFQRLMSASRAERDDCEDGLLEVEQYVLTPREISVCAHGGGGRNEDGYA